MVVRRQYPEYPEYPDELREHAVSMVLELRRRNGSSHGEIALVSRELGIHPESLRLWVRERESGTVRQPGATETVDSPRVAALEREIRELRHTIETVQAATAGNWRWTDAAHESSPLKHMQPPQNTDRD